MKRPHTKYLPLMRAAAVLLWAGAGVFVILHREALTPQAILSISPDDRALAAILLLLLYAGKTLSLVFPLKIPQLAAGLLLPTVPAVLVNLLGIAVSAAVGYGMGQLLGRDPVQRLTEKNPRLSAMLREQNGDVFGFSLLLRSMVFLPLDAVSLYFGAAGADFGAYLLGSVLGMLPNTVISTIMGAALSDPASPAFLASTACFLLLSTASLGFYLLRRKRRART